MQDNTAEWMSLENECVFICDELCLARMSASAQVHPAMHYWINEKARNEAAHRIPGYNKGGLRLVDYYPLFAKLISCLFLLFAVLRGVC